MSNTESDNEEQYEELFSRIDEQDVSISELTKCEVEIGGHILVNFELDLNNRDVQNINFYDNCDGGHYFEELYLIKDYNHFTEDEDFADYCQEKKGCRIITFTKKESRENFWNFHVFLSTIDKDL
jgi:hypothetical protein